MPMNAVAIGLVAASLRCYWENMKFAGGKRIDETVDLVSGYWITSGSERPDKGRKRYSADSPVRDCRYVRLNEDSIS